MANYRMLSKDFMTSPCVEELSDGVFRLYIMLNLVADDDGFVNNPLSEIRHFASTKEDYYELWEKGFIYIFNTNVCLIADWRVHNSLQKDRYKRTSHTEEFKLVTYQPKGDERYRPIREGQKSALQHIGEWNSKYALTDYDFIPPEEIGIVYRNCIQNLDTQNRIDKDREDKDKLAKRSLASALSQSLEEHNEEQIISSSKFKDYEEAFDKAVNN